MLGIVVQDLEMMEKLWLELMIGRCTFLVLFHKISSTTFLKTFLLPIIGLEMMIHNTDPMNILSILSITQVMLTMMSVS